LSQKYPKPECLFSLGTTKMSENFHGSFTKGYICVFHSLVPKGKPHCCDPSANKQKKKIVEKTPKFLSPGGPLCVLPTVALHTFLSKHVCFGGFGSDFFEDLQYCVTRKALLAIITSYCRGYFRRLFFGSKTQKGVFSFTMMEDFSKYF